MQRVDGSGAALEPCSVYRRRRREDPWCLLVSGSHFTDCQNPQEYAKVYAEALAGPDDAHDFAWTDTKGKLHTLD